MTTKQALKALTEEDLDMNDFKAGKDQPIKRVKKQSQFSKDLTNWAEEAKVITKNTFEFIETFSLLIVTAFAIYGSLTYNLRNEYKYSVLFSGVVVGLIAMNLLRKFLARR